MGLTYANIEIVNADDLAFVRKGIIGEDEIRQMTVRMMVDTGSILMGVNETIKEALGLPHFGTRRSQLANGHVLDLEVVGPIIVRYLDRDCTTNAVVLPDEQEPKLGMIPMGEMDLYVHPLRNELLPIHPEGPIMSLK